MTIMLKALCLILSLVGAIGRDLHLESYHLTKDDQVLVLQVNKRSFDLERRHDLLQHDSSSSSSSNSFTWRDGLDWVVVTLHESAVLKLDMMIDGESYVMAGDDPRRLRRELVDEGTGIVCSELEIPKNGSNTGVGKPNLHQVSRSIEDLQDGGAFFPGCFLQDERPHVLDIGIVTDLAFLEGKKGDIRVVQAEIEHMVATTNMVYETQFNVQLRIAQIRLATEDLELNKYNRIQFQSRRRGTCEQKIQTMIGQMVWFSQNVRQQTPHWHLVSGCQDKQGTLGLAYLDSLTSIGTYNVAVSYGLGGGGSSALWRVFAHELGHAFGATHSFENGLGTTGGLMDYGDGTIKGTSIFGFRVAKRNLMCSGLQSLKDLGTPYFTLSGMNANKCGDKRVNGADEECECVDGSTSCDGCVACKLQQKSRQCSTRTFYMRSKNRSVEGGVLSVDQCCNHDSGALEPVSTSCDGGYCSIDGQCVNHCDNYGMELCGVEANGCRQKCKSQDTSCSANFVDEDGHYISHSVDNALCSASGDAVCVSGTCVPTKEPTDKPTVKPTMKPTEEPTRKPTSKPTEEPTRKPTSKPTPRPTKASPTKKPTAAPTLRPTKHAPSRSPTLSPTFKPTKNRNEREDPQQTSQTDEEKENTKKTIIMFGGLGGVMLAILGVSAFAVYFRRKRKTKQQERQVTQQQQQVSFHYNQDFI